MKGSIEELIADFLYRKFPRVDVAILEQLANELVQLLEEHGAINDSE